MDKMLHPINDYIDILKAENLLIEADLKCCDAEKPVDFISYNSQDIKKGTLFLCKGAKFKEIFLQDAIKRGAFAYISEVKYDTGDEIAYIIVSDARRAMSLIASHYHNKVWKDITLVGITGTKGKSSTAYYIKHIFDDYLKENKKNSSAILSGIDNYDGVINEESHLTTPEVFELYNHYANAKASNIDFLTMEVSSQALKYGRTYGIQFNVGCFLNIGMDHISSIEHSDFEDYLNSKLIFMRQCDNAVINLNSDHCELAIAEAKKYAKRVITFGLTREADICGYDISSDSKGITFRVACDSFDEEFRLSMTGLFNVQNALAAIASCYALNIPIKHIKSGLKKAKVSGRMEIFTSREGFNVIVDYAHNQMSFDSLFRSTVQEYPGKKIYIVFGCPGKKALGRRKELSEIAGKYSEKVYITEEDAGEEPVMDICREIAGNLKGTSCSYDIIVDRREAIKAAIEAADKDTVVLITGKGRETRQKRGTLYIDTLSDVEIVEELLK